VHRTLHLVEHKLVGATQDDRRGTKLLGALDKDLKQQQRVKISTVFIRGMIAYQLIVRNTLLGDLVSIAEEGGLKGLFAVEIGKGGHEGGYI